MKTRKNKDPFLQTVVGGLGGAMGGYLLGKKISENIDDSDSTGKILPYLATVPLGVLGGALITRQYHLNKYMENPKSDYFKKEKFINDIPFESFAR